jgi:hypothetical protein
MKPSKRSAGSSFVVEHESPFKGLFRVYINKRIQMLFSLDAFETGFNGSHTSGGTVV